MTYCFVVKYFDELGSLVDMETFTITSIDAKRANEIVKDAAKHSARMNSECFDFVIKLEDTFT